MRNHDHEVAQRAEQAGMQKGLTRGLAQGMEQGIRALVEALEAVSQSRDAVIQTVADKFGLQPEIASEKVAQYWV